MTASTRHDGFCILVEELGERLGVTVRCHLMHRPAYVYDGEWFDAYDEFEVRPSVHDDIGVLRTLCFDVSLASFRWNLICPVVEAELMALSR